MVAFDFGAVLVDWRLFLSGIAMTLSLTVIGAVLGGLVGVVCAWVRNEGPIALRWLVGAYVELVRNTPFIVQLFFLFFGLPAAGIRMSAEAASVLAMVLNLGAYATEIVRAGLANTPKGQIEAAQSLAMGPVQIFTRVVLPPALRKVWPALVGQIIIVMLGSAVCSQISVEDISYAANLIQSRNFRAFESYIIASAIYLSLAIAMRYVLNAIGPRFIFRR